MEASGARPPGQGQQRTSRRLLNVPQANYTSAGSLVHIPGKDKPLQVRRRLMASRTKSLEAHKPASVNRRMEHSAVGRASTIEAEGAALGRRTNQASAPGKATAQQTRPGVDAATDRKQTADQAAMAKRTEAQAVLLALRHPELGKPHWST